MKEAYELIKIVCNSMGHLLDAKYLGISPEDPTYDFFKWALRVLQIDDPAYKICETLLSTQAVSPESVIEALDTLKGISVRYVLEWDENPDGRKQIKFSLRLNDGWIDVRIHNGKTEHTIMTFDPNSRKFARIAHKSPVKGITEDDSGRIMEGFFSEFSAVLVSEK